LDLIDEELDADCDDEDKQRVFDFLQAAGLELSAQWKLFKSAKTGDVDGVREAAEKGADVNLEDVSGCRAVNVAAAGGHGECLQALQQLGADIEGTDKDGWTPVHSAASARKLPVLKLLQEMGANMTALTTFKRNAMDLCVEGYDQADMDEWDEEVKENFEFLKSLGMEESAQGRLWRYSEEGDKEHVRLALEQGADVNLEDLSGKTAIQMAMDASKLVMVSFLIGNGAKWEGEPLAEAAQKCVCASALEGDCENLRAAVKLGADINKVDGGTTPLMDAACKGQAEVVKVLKELRADLEAKDKDEWTAVHFASMHASVEVLEMLSELGADLKAITKFRRNALDLIDEELDADCDDEDKQRVFDFLQAAGLELSAQWKLFKSAKTGDVDGVREAAEKGADVNLEDVSGCRAVNVAAAGGHGECLQALQQLGADIEGTDKDGWTPVHSAASARKLPVLKLLQEMGANMTALTTFKRNAMDLCVEGYDQADMDEWDEEVKENFEFLKSLGMEESAQGRLWRYSEEGDKEHVRLALEQGADVNLEDLSGKTAIQMAMDASKLVMVSFLIGNGAKWEGEPLAEEAQTWLGTYAREGACDDLRAAVELGADINKFVGSTTALMEAASGGQPEALEVLKELGADLETVDRDGWAAVHFAAHGEHLECLKKLCALGADMKAITKFKRNALDLVDEYQDITDGRQQVKEYLESVGLEISAQWRLWRSAAAGDLEGVQTALEQGAEVNFQNLDRTTALSRAEGGGHSDIVDFLKENGAEEPE